MTCELPTGKSSQGEPMHYYVAFVIKNKSGQYLLFRGKDYQNVDIGLDCSRWYDSIDNSPNAL